MSKGWRILLILAAIVGTVAYAYVAVLRSFMASYCHGIDNIVCIEEADRFEAAAALVLLRLCELRGPGVDGGPALRRLREGPAGLRSQRLAWSGSFGLRFRRGKPRVVACHGRPAFLDHLPSGS